MIEQYARQIEGVLWLETSYVKLAGIGTIRGRFLWYDQHQESFAVSLLVEEGFLAENKFCEERAMPKFRVGVQMHPQHTDWPTYADAVRRFDEMGVNSIWNWDHFFPLYGDPNGNHFEGWTLLSAMAAITSRAEVGCLVTCNSYRNPALLSNMAKTVDHISGGRLILGLGAGWFERDYNEYGYEFGTAPDRLRALRDALPVMLERWAKDVPAPIRNPIPILIGGGGEKVTLKLTAQYASIWHGFGPIETFQRKNAILDQWCAEVGRDPHSIERSVSPQQGESWDAYAEAGASHIILGMQAPFDFALIEQLIQWRDRHNA